MHLEKSRMKKVGFFEISSEESQLEMNIKIQPNDQVILNGGAECFFNINISAYCVDFRFMKLEE